MHPRVRLLLGLLLSGLIIWLFSPPSNAAAARTVQSAPQAGYAGTDTCLTCHSDKQKVYEATPHGHAKDPRSPAAKQGCESCHGPGKAHADAGGDKTKIRSFANLKPEE